MLLSIESFISIVTGFVGFLVVFLIAFQYRSNSLMNIYLLIGFIIVSIRLLHNGLNVFYENPTLNRIISIITPLLLSCIPSLYLYFQNLFYHQNRFRKRDLLHFIYPLSLFILLLLPIDFKPVQKFLQVCHPFGFINGNGHYLYLSFGSDHLHKCLERICKK